ncbi:MAG: DUF58 domain-containing protein [Bacillota bacterium]
MLFDRDLLRKLDNMAFMLKKARAGRFSGQHRSPRKGQSVEFADYRAYAAGDDWRQVDWNAYARLDRLFVKLFMEENDLLLNVLLDVSGSMGRHVKFKLAREIAGALGYLALVNSEQVGITALNNKLARYLPVQRGRASIVRLWNFLLELENGAETDLNLTLRQAGKHIKGAGISIVISDMLSPAGYADGLKYLQFLNQQVVVLHILAPEEREPGILGNFALEDCETGAVKEVSVTPLLLEKYRRRVEQFCSELRQFCRAREISYLTIDTSDNLEDILLRSLRSLEIVH